jgi:hypothetical protein
LTPYRDSPRHSVAGIVTTTFRPMAPYSTASSARAMSAGGNTRPIDDNDLLLFPYKNVVDLLPVWGDARCRDSPGLAISRHFAD